MSISRRALLAAIIALVVLAGGFLFWRSQQATTTSPSESARIVVNEAARTLLYLPLYHAQRSGYFVEENVALEIVTGGSATSSVAAIISGDADIAQADPMYAPISQFNGSDVVVVGQIVGRIGLWALARPGVTRDFSAAGLRGARIITHPQPMTAYTYATLFLRENGLGENGATLIQARPGTEAATYAAERSAQFIVSVEPVVSVLEAQGARVVYSWPEEVGDRVFSGLMVRRAVLDSKRDALRRTLRAYQRALRDIAANDPSVLATAREYFPSLEEEVLQRALARLRSERVFPESLEISQASWDSAVGARRIVGDISGEAPYTSNVEAEFIAEAIR